MTEKKLHRRLPSIAFVVTLLTGLFWTWFGVAESMGGFFKKPFDPSFAVGGLMEAATFGLSFLFVAWLLWVRPKIGAIILTVIGLGFGAWIILDFSHRDWIVVSLLAGLPIILGVFTFVRETISQHRLAGNN
jgi:hypothetical protein